MNDQPVTDEQIKKVRKEIKKNKRTRTLISVVICIIVLFLFVLSIISITEAYSANKYKLTSNDPEYETWEKCNKEDFFRVCDCVANVIRYNYNYTYTAAHNENNTLTFERGGDSEDYTWFFLDMMVDYFYYEGNMMFLPLEPKNVQDPEHYRTIAYAYSTKGFCALDISDTDGEVTLWKIKYKDNPYENYVPWNQILNKTLNDTN